MDRDRELYQMDLDERLIEASAFGTLNEVKKLLDEGANVNAQDKVGQTPLLNARNDLEIVRILIDAGANVNAQNRLGHTPLMYAASGGNFEIIASLLDAGADIDTRDKRGETVLMYAMNHDVIKFLLDVGANVNNQNRLGNTFLMQYGFITPEVVKMILDAGADVNIRNNRGVTALFRFIDPEIVKMLLEAGADVTIQSVDGETALTSLMNLIPADEETQIAKEQTIRLLYEALLKSTKPGRQYARAKRALSDLNQTFALTPRGGPARTLAQVQRPAFPRFPGGPEYRQAISQVYESSGQKSPSLSPLRRRLTPSPKRYSPVRVRSQSPIRKTVSRNRSLSPRR